MEYIIAPWEAEAYIESLQASELEDYGTKKWFDFHKKLILLNQECIMEINSLREESIKEWFVSFRKIPILIYEAIQTNIWKHKVFPLLININNEPSNTFMLFSVFYHEDIVVSLLENVSFHSESAEAMDDSVLDLIDYAMQGVMDLFDAKKIEVYETIQNPNSCLEEILEKKRELEFDIGMRCISILRYLAEFLDNLPLSVLSRMLTTHDIPYILVQLIEDKPWKKHDLNGVSMIYDGSWRKAKPDEDEKIPKIEGQIWLGLRELLLNPKCAPYYEITEHRFSQLMKLQKYMHESMLDQLAPLIDLKRWLSYLNISSASSSTLHTVNVEVIPQIKASILKKYGRKWKKLAKHQSKSLFTKNTEDIKNTAQILSDAYDLDKLESLDIKKCSLCEEPAKNRCSKCKEAWYCGRECQVKNWTDHKAVCDKMSKHKEI